MRHLRFLVLNRDNDDLTGITNYLRETGYDVVSMRDRDDCLELAASGDFQVGMIDLTMDDAEGIGTLKTIVERQKLSWVIALTDTESKESAIRECGADSCHYLNKPVVPAELKVICDNMEEVYSLRKEVSDKTLTVSRLEVLNDIAQETLLTNDENTLLWKVASLISERLSYFNVNISIVDESREHILLRAFAGGFGDDLVAGYSLNIGEGICGWIVENRESLLVNDVSIDNRRVIGFSFEDNVKSELGVPIMFNDVVNGVIHVESEELNAFSRDDIIILETVADQLALFFENKRLSVELVEAYKLSATINDSLPVSIILVDSDMKVKYVNKTFSETIEIGIEDIIRRPVTAFFSNELVDHIELPRRICEVIETGIPSCHTNIQHSSLHHTDKVLNITIARVQAGPNPRIMILIQDVTDFTVKARQLSLIREISIAMQGVFERDKLLDMILTSVTAGFAMGFNRAFLFLVSKEKNRLVGTMGVGPTSKDEAFRIWNDLSQRSFTFKDYLNDMSNGSIRRSGLQDLVDGMVFDLENDSNILTETVKTQQYIHVWDAYENPGVTDAMKNIVASNEFVSMPLIAKNEVIGVLLTDNAYSGTPITPESIEELAMFTAAAALAIENSHILLVLENQLNELENAYTELEKTHDMLIRHEKLAAVGEISTRLAHEIRNPLATIGGFAKSIPRKYEDRDRTIRNANIIIEEVKRLENILTNVLDFTKAGTPQKTSNNVNDLIKETVRIMEGGASGNNIVVVLELSNDNPEVFFDATQIKQVLINLIQNAFNAMPLGGALQITSSFHENGAEIRITDTGNGIPDEFLENVFDPFFTTHHDGTGLGLPISQRIIQNHKGRLDLQSTEGVGTTIRIVLPNN